jgi:hypothetical protein
MGRGTRIMAFRKVGIAVGQKMGILRWSYNNALREFFHSSTEQMADALKVGRATLHKALDIEGADEAVQVFEELARYCMENGLSLDKMLRQYRPDPPQ